MSLREFIDILDKNNELLKIDKQVSCKYEIAALTKHMDGREALLFNNIKESRFRVVTNACGTRRRFALALNTKEEEINEKIIYAINNHRKPEKDELKASNISKDLSILPIITHFEKDAGPFITSSIIYAKNENNIQNASVHRMLLLDDKHLAVRMVEGRHLHRCYQYAKEHGEDLRVAVAIGVHPAVLIASAYQAAYNFDEMEVAAALTNLKVATINGLEVPSDAEIVLEGRILQDVYEEEYMVEMLKTYDHKRKQPV
ncbi:MAG: UbiD family decarboxylase, partial [Candidatus Nitrosothermus koennekii]